MNDTPTDAQLQVLALSIAMSQVRLKIDRCLAMAALFAASAVAVRFLSKPVATAVLAALCIRELLPAALLMRVHRNMRLLRQRLSRV